MSTEAPSSNEITELLHQMQAGDPSAREKLFVCAGQRLEAIARKKLLCLDAGHFHPTEVISDKISSVLSWLDELLLHVSRGVRWDSDHVVILSDELEAIAQELAKGDDPELALQRYEKRRLPPTAAIVESNRRKGIDVMLDIVEQRDPQGFSNLETVLPADELERIVAGYKKLAVQDRETLLKMAGQT